jgi:hypothetical protein
MVSSKDKTSASQALLPDAWSRFERAVDVVAKSPPQHRAKLKSESTATAAENEPKTKDQENPEGETAD